MSVSLSYTDAANGTGGTATIAGSTGGTVTIYGQQVSTTPLTTPAFTSVGSRTGDGTVTLSLAVGYWWLFASDGAAISSLLYATSSDSSKAVHERALLAIKARIQGLTLAGLPSSQVYDQFLPNSGTIMYPCVLLTLEGDQETAEGVLTSLDDIGYPVRIWIVDRAELATPDNRPKYLLWRQQIFRALRNQKLAGVPEVYQVRVEPLTIVDPRLPAYQLFITGLRARCLSREIRG